jgi:hypothetical protein
MTRSGRPGVGMKPKPGRLLGTLRKEGDVLLRQPRCVGRRAGKARAASLVGADESAPFSTSG